MTLQRLFKSRDAVLILGLCKCGFGERVLGIQLRLGFRARAAWDCFAKAGLPQLIQRITYAQMAHELMLRNYTSFFGDCRSASFIVCRCLDFPDEHHFDDLEVVSLQP